MDGDKFRFDFCLSAEDSEKFIGQFDFLLDKCKQKIDAERMASSLDPGYISQLDSYEKDLVFFTTLRNVAASSKTIVQRDTLAAELFDKSHMYDILKKKYFDFEIGNAIDSGEVVVTVGAIDSKFVGDVTIYTFTDKSYLLTFMAHDGQYVVHNSKGYKLL